MSYFDEMPLASLRHFEIPYNFDKNLIYFLDKMNPDRSLIYCIFLPPWFEDYPSVLRSPLMNDTVGKYTWEEYLEHIQLITSVFPGKIQLLLQQNKIIMEDNILQKYINLGITKFCVGSVEQARQIRKYLPYASITASITMNIDNKKIEKNYNEYQIFDSIVLPFKFARDLENIRSLPKQFKYFLIVNNSCSIYCTGIHHWFASKEDIENNNIICPRNQHPLTWNNITTIRPMDLILFDPYIYAYKIEGREGKTFDILQNLFLYSAPYQKYPYCEPQKELYLADNFNKTKIYQNFF